MAKNRLLFETAAYFSVYLEKPIMHGSDAGSAEAFFDARKKMARCNSLQRAGFKGILLVVEVDELQQMLVTLLGSGLVLSEQNGSAVGELTGQTAVTGLVH